MQLSNHVSFSTKVTRRNGTHNDQYYQSIYTSQLYGTFFVVYANFKTEENLTNDSYSVKNITLKIMNYKGLINIGIENAEFEAFWDQEQNNSLGGIITLQLKALASDHCLVRNIDPTHPFPKGESFLMVDRKLSKMSSNPDGIQNGIFDEEFFYRDGFQSDASGNLVPYTQLRTVKPDIDDSITEEDVQYPLKKYAVGIKGLAVPRCARSKNLVI